MGMGVEPGGPPIGCEGGRPLKEVLTARTDPMVLYCENVLLIRHSAQKGYAFMEHPNSCDVVVYAMAETRPLMFIRAGKEAELEYSEDEMQKALDLRLRLIAASTLYNWSATRLDGEAPPVLVIPMPGCVDGIRHPVRSVASALERFRKIFGRHFTAVVVACGQDIELAGTVDDTVNADFYDGNLELKPDWMPATWEVSDASLKRLRLDLLQISANEVWSGRQRTKATGQRGRSTEEQVQQNANIARANVASLASIAKGSAFEKKSSVFAEMLSEQRQNKAKLDFEADLEREVHKLASRLGQIRQARHVPAAAPM